MFVNSIKKRDDASFTSRQSDIARAEAFVNMNDHQVKQLAYATSFDRKEQKKQHDSVKKYFLAIPVVDTLISGIAPEGLTLHPLKRGAKGFSCGIGPVGATLGGRAISMAECGMKWGALIAGIGIYNKIKKSAVQNSSALQSFEQTNPVLGFVADIGILTGAYFAGTKGLSKLAETFPRATKRVAYWLTDKTYKLNKTKFSQKTLPKLMEKVAGFAEKHPKLAEAGATALRHSMFILVGLGIIKAFGNSHKNHVKVAEKYEEIKDAQLKTAKHLIDIQNAEEVIED